MATKRDEAKRGEARRGDAVGDAKVSFITNCAACMRTATASVLSACVQRVNGTPTGNARSAAIVMVGDEKEGNKKQARRNFASGETFEITIR